VRSGGCLQYAGELWQSGRGVSKGLKSGSSFESGAQGAWDAVSSFSQSSGEGAAPSPEGPGVGSGGIRCGGDEAVGAGFGEKDGAGDLVRTKWIIAEHHGSAHDTLQFFGKG